MDDFILGADTNEPLAFDEFTSSYLDGPTDHPLWPIRAKIARADHHLNILGKKVGAFLDNEPYGVAHYCDGDARQYVWYVVVSDSPDPRWGLLVSEMAHHLNSALDHIIWLVAALHSGSPPRGTGFPIAKSASEFRKLWTRSSGYYRIRALPVHAQAIIEDEQPFHRGNAYEGHPFWVLRRLANADKHEALVVVGGAVGKGSVKVTQEGGDVPVKPVKFTNGPFKDGYVVARWPLPGAGPKGMKIQLDVSFEFQISLPDTGPGKGREVFRVMAECRNAVDDLVTRLAPFVI